MEKIALVVTMRTGSSRMPSKMTEPIADGMNSVDFFARLFEKLQNKVDPVIAVPEFEIFSKTKLVEKILSRKIKIYGGSEHDVFKRVLCAAGKNKYILDITGDCPFISLHLIDEFIEKYRDKICSGDQFYASNVFPTRLVPDGQDIQLYSKSLMNEVNTDYIPEHSGYSVYRWMKENRATDIMVPYCGTEIKNQEKIRMTLDTVQDIQTLMKLHKFFKLFNYLESKYDYEQFMKYVCNIEKSWWPNRYILAKKIQN